MQTKKVQTGVQSCPVVKTGKHCIEVSSAAKLACISEELCIGCGICVKKCPFEAIQIINLPKSLEKETTHCYGPNTFKLHRLPVPKPGQVLGLVGTNGIGKSTALKVLAGKLKPNLGCFENPPDWQEILAHFRGSELQNYFTCILEDNLKAGLVKPDVMEGEEIELPKFNVSYKWQKISLEFEGTVREMLGKRIRESYLHPQFISDVMKPLQIEQLMDQKFATLSGGELQRVSICLCLGKPADIYLIDEPSAYLDSEQRIVASKVIKRYILHAKKTAFVVEHDFIMATYLADKVIVYEGKPSIDCVANAPQSLVSGMNLFLSHLDITFRRDPTNYRPRINKLDSAKDREQKNAGSYYYLDD